MNKILLAVMLFLILSAGGAGCAGAEGAQRYFSALPDVPLLSTMREVEDMTVVFDKAEGRVVETAAFYPMNGSQKEKMASKKTLEDSYGSALRQLGWKVQNSLVYARNGEQLVGNIQEVRGGLLLRLQLSPVSR